jgi:hypothetical protein
MQNMQNKISVILIRKISIGENAHQISKSLFQYIQGLIKKYQLLKKKKIFIR